MSHAQAVDDDDDDDDDNEEEDVEDNFKKCHLQAHEGQKKYFETKKNGFMTKNFDKSKLNSADLLIF